MRSPDPWNGLPEAAVSFFLAHASLALFFGGGLLPQAIVPWLWASVGTGALAFLAYTAHFSQRAKKVDRDGISGDGQMEMQSLLAGGDEDEEDEDDVGSAALPAPPRLDEAGGGSGGGGGGGDGGSGSGSGGGGGGSSTGGPHAGSHRYGTRSPFWFTRVWAGFEDEAEAEAAASQADRAEVSGRSWRPGQTSRLRDQAGRSSALRGLMVGLGAAAPYYLGFLGVWMRRAFGLPGLLFTLAEAIATAARVGYWAQLWSGQHRRVRPLWRLDPPFPEEEWPLVEVRVGGDNSRRKGHLPCFALPPPRAGLFSVRSSYTAPTNAARPFSVRW